MLTSSPRAAAMSRSASSGSSGLMIWSGSRSVLALMNQRAMRAAVRLLPSWKPWALVSSKARAAAASMGSDAMRARSSARRPFRGRRRRRRSARAHQAHELLRCRRSPGRGRGTSPVAQVCEQLPAVLDVRFDLGAEGWIDLHQARAADRVDDGRWQAAHDRSLGASRAQERGMVTPPARGIGRAALVGSTCESPLRH